MMPSQPACGHSPIPRPNNLKQVVIHAEESNELDWRSYLDRKSVISIGTFESINSGGIFFPVNDRLAVVGVAELGAIGRRMIRCAMTLKIRKNGR